MVLAQKHKKMLKLLQINVTSNWGSTGKIAEQIGKLAILNGWESYIAYGRYNNPSESETIKIGNDLIVYEHYLENYFLDNEGLASKNATKRLINEIKEIKPSIIHLHNIHDHYINYPILFNYLSSITTPIVWTQHDCWAFTGGCGYYSFIKCIKWQTGCDKCPLRSTKIDKRMAQYQLKKMLFNSVKNLTLVPVSNWLAGELKQSFLNQHSIVPIYNGVDVSLFKYTSSGYVREKYNIGDAAYAIGVATVWDSRKNLKDYITLATLFQRLTIVLVGLTKKQIMSLPPNIIGIPRTQNAQELAALYSEADVVLNLSLEETFGLTTAEGLACGTPAIVYNCTASPELINSETGRVIKQGDIISLGSTIKWMLDNPMSSDACRKRAEEFFNKDKCYMKYIELYKKLLENIDKERLK